MDEKGGKIIGGIPKKVKVENKGKEPKVNGNDYMNEVMDPMLPLIDKIFPLKSFSIFFSKKFINTQIFINITF